MDGQKENMTVRNGRGMDCPSVYKENRIGLIQTNFLSEIMNTFGHNVNGRFCVRRNRRLICSSHDGETSREETSVILIFGGHGFISLVLNYFRPSKRNTNQRPCRHIYV